MHSRVALCIGFVLAGIAPARAHHYFASTFDVTKPVALRGVLTRIQWSNPHTHFYFDVKESDGAVWSWVCEWSAPGSLTRRGFTRSDINVGDTIRVDGLRAKDGSRSVIARRVTLPDGRVVADALAGEGGPP